mgnify:CR=1 FL=1
MPAEQMLACIRLIRKSRLERQLIAKKDDDVVDAEVVDEDKK